MTQESISRHSDAAPRVYRSELRQRQAEETRDRIITAAAECFAADGYVRTTLAKIGAAAGVSTETVQGHGPKAALLIAAVEHAAFGVSGEENVLNLETGRKVLAAETPAEGVRLIAAEQTAVHLRTAPLVRTLFTAAGADAELDRYVDQLMAGIKLQVSRVTAVYRERGWIREDLSVDELVETSAALSSVELFLRITGRDGWSAQQYQAWLQRMLWENIFSTAVH